MFPGVVIVREHGVKTSGGDKRFPSDRVLHPPPPGPSPRPLP